jgi:DNA-binding PadR family transcriptional regulator
MTPLSYALLGLIRMLPRSGYALRKVFETTPLGNYSSSPGSIYPALKSLEKAGLVRTVDTAETRGKGLYHLAPAGGAALDQWQRAPVEDLGEAMLRFAFLAEEDDAAIAAFLDSFEAAAQARAAGLETFLAGDAAQGMSIKHRIAVEHGRRNLEASADWARWARAQFGQGQGRDR